MKKVKYKSKKKEGGMKKLWKIVIIVAVVLVVLAAGFLGVRAYEKNRQDLIFTNGVQFGYAQAIVQMMNLSLSCEPVPLYAGNATLNVVAVGCLPQQIQDQIMATAEQVEPIPQ